MSKQRSLEREKHDLENDVAALEPQIASTTRELETKRQKPAEKVKPGLLGSVVSGELASPHASTAQVTRA
jgi:hypothetical protein